MSVPGDERPLDEEWLNDRSEYQRNFVHGLRNASGLHLQYRLIGDHVVTTWVPGEDHAGFPGVVHGGLIAAVLDDVMGRCSVLQRRWVVTGRMETRFREVAPLGAALLVEGWTTRFTRRVMQPKSAHDARRRHRRRAGEWHLPAGSRRVAHPDGGRVAGLRRVHRRLMGDPGAGDAVEEREVKLTVPDGFSLPDLAGAGHVTISDGGEDRLHAVYWDTAELGLVHAGVGLRHRNGVWTYKGRSRREGHAVVREEVEVAGGGDTIPTSLRDRVQRWISTDELRPVAELDTMRHKIDVADGAAAAELVHDRVSVRDGARVAASFEEVEVEFATTSQDLADRVVRVLLDAGAVVDDTPKYLRALRALGFDPPLVSA